MANRLWPDTWQVTDSTHGMEVRRLALGRMPGGDDIQREVWLWDLAGQPEYRLTHQLFMEQTSLAVVDRQRVMTRFPHLGANLITSPLPDFGRSESGGGGSGSAR